MSKIVFSSITQLAAAIRAGDVLAVEVMEAHLAQIEAHNPALNAIITPDVECAQARAREANAARARGELWAQLKHTRRGQANLDHIGRTHVAAASEAEIEHQLTTLHARRRI